MAAFASSQIRNIVLAAHSGAGKTTLADAMYYKTGVVNRRGRVDDQTSLSDYEPEEQERGSSVQMAILPCSSGKSTKSTFSTRPVIPTSVVTCCLRCELRTRR